MQQISPKPKTLLSPDDSVSGPAIINIQHATTRIKEIVTRGVMIGLSQNDMVKELNQVIAECVANIKQKDLQEEVRQALIISARRWHYELSETIKIHNHNLAVQFAPIASIYSLDLNQMLLGSPSKIIERFRPYMDFHAQGAVIIQDYEKGVRLGIKAISAEPPISTRLKKNGEPVKVNLRNRVEMAIRYDANLQDVEKLQKDGVKLVWTSSHPNCSPRCAPHQGKLYSLDGTSGVIDGHRFTPLQDVLKLNGGNSIINGYNCRHRLIEYREGSHPPTDYSEAEINREYQIDQRQRHYENTIRNMKTEERLLRASGDLEGAKILRKKWRILNQSYQAYSLKNGRAYYPWRTVISKDEAQAQS